jgi:P-type Cu+ transporter
MASRPEAAGYTCPMHPEVQRSASGSCPKCGMALERVEVPAPADRVQYTCPMHPQIVDALGFAAKCVKEWDRFFKLRGLR